MDVAPYLPRSRFDIAVAAVGLGLAAAASWVPGTIVSDGVAGSTWLLVVYPVLLAVPLAWRRHSPLVAACLVLAAVMLQAIVSGNSVEGLHVIYCVGVSVYAVAAYSGRLRSLVGLAVAIAVWSAYVAENRDIQSGQHNELWAGAFFTVALIATWLVGVYVRGRRLERENAARVEQLKAEAARAVADERARLARELHDVISHNISVMLVQAAGARAAGSSDSGALEKIEDSARESLVEMRRLLGVLRSDDGGVSLLPMPGLDDLAALVDQLRAAGLSVELQIRGGAPGLPAAVGLSVYRVVQESLTNVLKHSRSSTACVQIQLTSSRVTVEITDAGHGPPIGSRPGHGLIGMRERVAAFGGTLDTGPGSDGGYRVRAIFPVVVA